MPFAGSRYSKDALTPDPIMETSMTVYAEDSDEDASEEPKAMRGLSNEEQELQEFLKSRQSDYRKPMASNPLAGVAQRRRSMGEDRDFAAASSPSPDLKSEVRVLNPYVNDAPVMTNPFEGPGPDFMETTPPEAGLLTNAARNQSLPEEIGTTTRSEIGAIVLGIYDPIQGSGAES